ncbi:MAG: alpha/beta hydrolase [Gordonia sp. (in: high G+C Gram-positive bacteria)]
MTAAPADRRAEVRALSELGLTEFSKASVGIHSTHRAISDRVFSIVSRGAGPVSRPVKVVHDAITDGVYRIIAESTSMAGKVTGETLDLPMRVAPSQTKYGAELIGMINGLIGDELDGKQSPLAAEPMTVRQDGRTVALTADDVAREFPFATGRIAVFLHGLVETEHAWHWGGGEDGVTYGGWLAASADITPVDIRYNTGRHISTNGHDLAELLDDLVRFWPVSVEDVTLVGHSMGGLVARSAAHHAVEAELSWPRLVGTTVCLGTPHLGAPLEELAHQASAVLSVFPETEAFGRLLRRRSDGIRDLRAGSLIDDDWTGRDPDDVAAAIAAEIPLLPGAEHYFISATVTRNPANPVARVLGDGLVLHHSASGKNSMRRIGFAEENGLHLGRAHHFTLLNDERIAEQLVTWLTR